MEQRFGVILSGALLMTTPLAAKSISEADLRPHIETMASDAFEGREPGTEGERKTLEYLSNQWRQMGLKPGAKNGGWLEEVPLIRRGPAEATAHFYAKNQKLRFASDEMVLVGKEADYLANNVPVVFVGHGVNKDGNTPDDLAGKLVFMLSDSADFLPEAMQSPRVRREALVKAGAEAVVAIAGEQFDFAVYRRQFLSRPIGLASQDKKANLEGVVSSKFMVALVTAAGGDWDKLRTAAKMPYFSEQLLGIAAEVLVKTDVSRFSSHNIIGKIQGRKRGSGAVVFMGHWDHLGLCRPEGETDRICNGAVDNASGMAVLTEIARRLAKGRFDRDIYFVGTTAEESGLLGAQSFVDNPIFPLDDIVIALNVDTIAVAPKGAKVSIIGRGTTVLEPEIEAVAKKVGRTIEASTEANAFLRRQDGWVLTQKGVPALMVGGSFADMELMERFLNSEYHGPEDEYGPKVELGGAAEDANLHVALGKYFASAKKHKRKIAENKTGG